MARAVEFLFTHYSAHVPICCNYIKQLGYVAHLLGGTPLINLIYRARAVCVMSTLHFILLQIIYIHIYGRATSYVTVKKRSS